MAGPQLCRERHDDGLPREHLSYEVDGSAGHQDVIVGEDDVFVAQMLGHSKAHKQYQRRAFRWTPPPPRPLL